MIIRNHTTKDISQREKRKGQPDWTAHCIYKIVRRSRAQKCELREFECKGTQFFR